MTRTKAKIYCQALILALLPGFVARPVVVGIHNSDPLSFHQKNIQILSPATPFKQFSSPRVAFRRVERESSDVTVWVPFLSKGKSLSISATHLTIVSTPACFSPRNFLVLRI